MLSLFGVFLACIFGRILSTRNYGVKIQQSVTKAVKSSFAGRLKTKSKESYFPPIFVPKPDAYELSVQIWFKRAGAGLKSEGWKSGSDWALLSPWKRSSSSKTKTTLLWHSHELRGSRAHMHAGTRKMCLCVREKSVEASMAKRWHGNIARLLL